MTAHELMILAMIIGSGCLWMWGVISLSNWVYKPTCTHVWTTVCFYHAHATLGNQPTHIKVRCDVCARVELWRIYHRGGSSYAAFDAKGKFLKNFTCCIVGQDRKYET